MINFILNVLAFSYTKYSLTIYPNKIILIIKDIVDKTASFVARNGPEFEARIRQNELGNPKFNFLNSGDPYHAYYQHKVSEFREGKRKKCNLWVPDGNRIDFFFFLSNLSAEPQSSGQKLQVSSAAHQKQQELLKQVAEQQFVPKEPPPDFEFIADPPSISALDLWVNNNLLLNWMC